MFLMTGPSGAGKTTLARQLATQLNVKYVGIEDFYRRRFGSELIHKDRELVWADFEDELHKLETAGVDIIVDTNAPSRADREWFVQRFPKYEIHLIVVRADKEICFLNNRRRKRVIPEDEMENIFARLEDVSTDEMKNYASANLYRNFDNSGVKFVERLK